METLQTLYTFLYSYGAGPTLAFNTAAVFLGIDSYMFEQSVRELYIILIEELLKVPLKILEVGICSSF
jgi:hypothetical protein